MQFIKYNNKIYKYCPSNEWWDVNIIGYNKDGSPHIVAAKDIENVEEIQEYYKKHGYEQCEYKLKYVMLEIEDITTGYKSDIKFKSFEERDSYINNCQHMDYEDLKLIMLYKREINENERNNELMKTIENSLNKIYKVLEK